MCVCVFVWKREEGGGGGAGARMESLHLYSVVCGKWGGARFCLIFHLELGRRVRLGRDEQGWQNKPIGFIKNGKKKKKKIPGRRYA